MKKTLNSVSADEIADMAENGKNIAQYFSNNGKMQYPIQRVNVDFTLKTLEELDALARELNISRQALIKTYIRQSLDQHYLAQAAKQ